MFYHKHLAGKENFNYEGIDFEIVVYRAEEDGHLTGYVSSGGFSDRIVLIPGETANDMKVAHGIDPVKKLIETIKQEIGSGKYDFYNQQ